MLFEKVFSEIFDRGAWLFGKTRLAMPGIGAVRLILAFAVVMGHTGGVRGYDAIVSAAVAVQIFYMISGFFIFMILSDKYGSVVAFYKSRAFRIYPTYLFLLILTMAAYAALHMLSAHGNAVFDTIAAGYKAASPLSVAFFCVVNAGAFFLDSLIFLATNPDTGGLYFTANFTQETYPAISWIFVSPAWTLGLELMFYLLAPLLVRLKTRFLIVGIMLSLALRFAVNHFHALPFSPWNYMFFPFELSQFLLGAVAYRFYRSIRDEKLFDWVAPFVAAYFIYSVFQFSQLSPHINAWDESVEYYLVPASLGLPFLFHVSKNNRVDRWCGELSYPIYLSHILIIFLFYSWNEKLAASLTTQTLFAIPVMAAALVLAALINHFIQAPIDRMRHRKFK